MMANVDSSCNYRLTQSSSWLAWSEGQLPPCSNLHSSNEMGELLSYDDSTINIVVVIIIIVIGILVITLYTSFSGLVMC